MDVEESIDAGDDDTTVSEEDDRPPQKRQRLSTTDALSNKYSDCEICHNIWRYFTDPEIKWTIMEELGTFDDLIKSDRLRHAPLIRSFFDASESDIS